MTHPDLTTSLANGRVTRLAALDSSRPPAAPVLLALVNGEPQAAVSLADGQVVADPFRRTACLIDLMRLHPRRLEASGRIKRGRNRLRSCGRTAAQLLGRSVCAGHGVARPS